MQKKSWRACQHSPVGFALKCSHLKEHFVLSFYKTMSFLRVLRAFFKVNLQQELAYRADTVVNILLSIMWTIWELLGIAIIFSNTPEIGGWKAADLIALLGVFRLVHTLMAAIVWPNTEEFNKGIREGTLDYVFLLPVNTQAVVSLRRIIVWRVWDILLGIILIAIGLFGARDSLPTIPNILVFIALAISGAAIIYSVWIVMISLTFWLTKFDNNVTLMQALMDTGRYPSVIYPPWLRVIVTFIVPIAVATTVPLQALRGELTPAQIVLALAVSVIAFVISRLVWRAGTRRYSGASA